MKIGEKLTGNYETNIEIDIWITPNLYVMISLYNIFQFAQ